MTSFSGTTGNDDLVGTAGNDTFNIAQGGNDTVSGGDGGDVIDFGAATLLNIDQILQRRPHDQIAAAILMLNGAALALMTADFTT